ncbi:cation-translocating P-type ATPase [Clostridium bornimense]|nr:cation-translocating P-type ATPase [Clostridium bornimense]
MTNLNNSAEIVGLTNSEAKLLQERYGKNNIVPEKKESFIRKVLEVLKEPMFLLLLVAATIYFILGEPRDGIIMLIFVVAVIGIDVVQEWKTDKTLKALRNLSAPHITVIRDGIESTINSEDLVPGDLMIISEGVKVPADGFIIKANDLCIDESSLTGESICIWKSVIANNNNYWKNNYCYAGTLVIQGRGIIKVEKIGVETEYGKIGKNVYDAKEEATPLQKQTSTLVKICAYIAAILFLLVVMITYVNLMDYSFKDRIIESILSAITLAMAMIPEEFPVILTVVLSMGAWRLAKKNSLVRKLPSVETLGAVSVLCVDKTGTITMNKMTVKDIWTIKNDIKDFSTIMGMACEVEAYDPMEQAIIEYCEKNDITKDILFSGTLIKEYSFTNKRKMMGHVWKKDGGIIVATKGSPEKIMALCDLDKELKKDISSKMKEMSLRGLRVIAVGKMVIEKEEEIPRNLEQCKLEFLGLVALQDPPRETVKEDIANCSRAGIRVVMITGDNGITASAIAKDVGIIGNDNIITGDIIDTLSDEELREKVKNTNIFSRVVPEHKMRIVKAFKENGEIVAMTGDGVNDAPALKKADIGIAMGKRGSEVAREAADLILLDDNFSTIVYTVKDGRRIYDNIKKAIGYVFAIHIPIAFSSLLAPLLGIGSKELLLLPIHVVLLELIIDPTCSIVLERQPAEDSIMEKKPRNPNEKILTSNLLIKSVIQGFVLFIAAFGIYYIYLIRNQSSVEVARSMAISIIMISNLLLVQVNNSNKEYAYKSFIKLRKDKVMWSVIIATMVAIVVILYTPISSLLKLAPLTIGNMILVLLISVSSIMWYEIVKFFKNR